MLAVHNVSVAYGKQTVLHPVSCSVEAGEVLCIVGESGSGKTTLLRTMGVCLPRGAHLATGSVYWQGEDLYQMPAKTLRTLRGPTISMVFQDTGSMLNPVRRIEQQCHEYLRCHTDWSREERTERLEEVFHALCLHDTEHILRSYPFQLSGGQRQRLGIALALVLEPDILLADEPTAALDVITQAQLIQEWQSLLRKRHTAMVLVTHNLGLARVLADQLLVLEHGRVAEQGFAGDVLTAPQSAYTKSLLAAVPMLQL